MKGRKDVQEILKPEEMREYTVEIKAMDTYTGRPVLSR